MDHHRLRFHTLISVLPLPFHLRSSTLAASSASGVRLHRACSSQNDKHWVATQVLSNARIEIIAVRMVQSVAPQTLCAARVVVAVEMDAAVAEILVLSSTVLAFVARLANSAMVRLDALKMAKFNVQERHSAALPARLADATQLEKRHVMDRRPRVTL